MKWIIALFGLLLVGAFVWALVIVNVNGDTKAATDFLGKAAGGIVMTAIMACAFYVMARDE